MQFVWYSHMPATGYQKQKTPCTCEVKTHEMATTSCFLPFTSMSPSHPKNYLTLSVSLIHILVFHLLTTLHKSDPHCYHHLCHHQSLLLFFILDLKHTSSSSLFHLRFHHRYSMDLPHGLLLIGFVLVLVLG